MNIKENISLAPLTTFKVGGMARYFAEAKTENEIKEAIFFARQKGVPFFILGGGSNILVSDSGFPGLVIKISSRGIKHDKEGDVIKVTVEAGEQWDDFVAYAVGSGWRGVENLSGVPGSVGAAPVQNIGCYGTEVKDVIESVRAVNTDTGEDRVFLKEECGFGYRESFFKKPEGKKFVITSVVFKLLDSPYLDNSDFYKDNRFNIGELMGEKSANPTIKDLREVVLSVRKEKGMLVTKDAESHASAGSFFGAPILSRDYIEKITSIAGTLDKEKERRLRPWFWEIEGGRVKVAPAFLLEFTPYNKGYVRGKVGISPKHSLSIINLGGGASGEIYNLAKDMSSEVKKIFEIDIHPEVVFIGDF